MSSDLLERMPGCLCQSGSVALADLMWPPLAVSSHHPPPPILTPSCSRLTKPLLPQTIRDLVQVEISSFIPLQEALLRARTPVRQKRETRNPHPEETSLYRCEIHPALGFANYLHSCVWVRPKMMNNSK